MKAASKHRSETETTFDPANWKVVARQLEQDGDEVKAIVIYTGMLKKQPLNAYIYDRLMIVYRKQKQYKKELSTVTAAIEKFTKVLRPAGNSQSKKIAALSKSILHAVGLTDKKGKPVYSPQPIARWENRLRVIRQKLAGK